MELIQFYSMEVIISFVCAVLSTVFYFFTPWRKTWAGRLLFIVLLNFAIVLGLIIFRYWFHLEHRGAEIARFIIYSLTMANMIIVLGSIIIGQYYGSKQRKLEKKYNDDHA